MTRLTLLDGERDEGPFAAPTPLPSRLPPGRHGIPAGLVVEHQRRRLLAAMGEALAANGYAEVTTTDVSRSAGVSTATFYRHFGNLWDCLLAAYVAGADLLCERIEAACAGEGAESGAPALERGIGAALELLAAEPALAHLLCAQPPLEAAAVSAARRLLIARLAALLRRGRGHDDDTIRPPGLDERMIDATLGFVHTRVCADEGARLAELVPELTAILGGAVRPA